MPTLYWGPWLAKIRRGGPALQYTYMNNSMLEEIDIAITKLSWFSTLFPRERIIDTESQVLLQLPF